MICISGSTLRCSNVVILVEKLSCRRQSGSRSCFRGFQSPTLDIRFVSSWLTANVPASLTSLNSESTQLAACVMWWLPSGATGPPATRRGWPWGSAPGRRTWARWRTRPPPSLVTPPKPWTLPPAEAGPAAAGSPTLPPLGPLPSSRTASRWPPPSATTPQSMTDEYFIAVTHCYTCNILLGLLEGPDPKKKLFRYMSGIWTFLRNCRREKIDFSLSISI